MPVVSSVWLAPAIAGVIGLALGVVAAAVAERWPHGEPITWPPRPRDARVGPPVVFGCSATAVGIVALLGVNWSALAAGALALALVPVVVVDLRHRLIPDLVVVPATAVALPAAILADPPAWWVPVACALGAGGFIFALWVIRPSGMGLGDAKLAVLMGAALGPSVIVALAVAFAAGALLGVALLSLIGRRARAVALPFAPFLAAGALAAPWLAPPVLAW